MAPSQRTIKLGTFWGFCHGAANRRRGHAGLSCGSEQPRTSAMPWRAPILTRRTLLAGNACLLVGSAAVLVSRLAGAQERPDAGNGVRVLRARPLASGESLPGPPLRVRRGDEVRARLINELPDATALHWHGVRVPNAMDGVPSLTQAPVAPGASFDYAFRAPDAGTFWYHLQPPGQAAALHGALVVEESEPVAADRDVALVLSATEQFVRVNGQSSLDLAVKANERIRLRLINASYRMVGLRFDPHRATVMAVDGQPAEPRVSDTGVGLGPGNRMDLFMDMVAPGAQAPLRLVTGKDEFEIARFRYDSGE